MAKSSAPTFDATMRVVVLRGQDAYLREAYSRQLREALEGAHGEIGLFDFDGRTAEPAVILDELRSYGLLQTYKMVIVDNADKLLAGGDESGGRGTLTTRQLFERYTEKPVDSATLLLRAEGWRPGKLDKLVAKVGAVVKCDVPSPATAIRWVASRATRQHAVKLAPDAAGALVDRLGPNLTRLDSELGKLAAYVGEGGTIDLEVIRQMVGLSREQQAWIIQAALLSRDPATALGRLRELLDVSQQPEQLLSWAMVDLLRKLHTGARLLASGLPPAAVAKELKLWGEARDGVMSVVRSLPADTLAALLHDAILADRGTKSGLGKSRRTLEVLALQIADTLNDGARQVRA